MTGTRRSGGLIPSWVVYITIIIAVLALCITVIVRAHSARREASAQYQKIDGEVDSLHHSNTELAAEARRLIYDPRTIEAAARERLKMVWPNEVIVAVDNSPAIKQRGSYGEIEFIKSDALNNRLLPYLILLLYCGVAGIGGFIVVKSFIALWRYIACKGKDLRSKLPSSETGNMVSRRHELSPLSRLALLLVCGLLLTSGFVYAAGQHFIAVQYNYKSEALRRAQASLLEEQRRLLLERERAAAPQRLEAAARQIGMIPLSAASVAISVRDLTEPIAPNNIVASNSVAAPNNNTVISPTTLKIVLIVLAILGGALGVMFSLPIRIRSRAPGIKGAPGANYLLIVDFLYSPKAVEEIFRPIVADWRTEYFDALKQGRTIKARWISIRYTFRFVSAMGLSQIYALVKTFKSAGK